MVTMTHKKLISVPKIALYEPDIPQNTAAIIRTCSCLGAILEIIEPCGFLFNDKRFKRVVMDYLDENMVKIYSSAEEFFDNKKSERIIKRHEYSFRFRCLKSKTYSKILSFFYQSQHSHGFEIYIKREQPQSQYNIFRIFISVSQSHILKFKLN